MLSQDSIHSADYVATKTATYLVIPRLMLLAFVSIALCVVIVTEIARLGTVPRIIEPPPGLLPGNPLPSSVHCGSTYDRRFECRVTHDGEIIGFITDSSSGTIIHVTITAHRRTIGNLVVAWGTPTGFTRTGYAVYVFWGLRWAFVFTCSLEPDSQITFIGYELAGSPSAQQPKLPWRGFTNVDGYKCTAKPPIP